MPTKALGFHLCVVTLGCLLLSSSLARAQPLEGAEIVGPLPNEQPKASTAHNPAASDLIETWLAGYDWPPGKRFDQERYEILADGVSWGNSGRAILVLRLLPLQGDALALARQRCPGRETPIDVQIYFEWSDFVSHWVAIDNRGDPGFDACPRPTTLWTKNQLAELLNPPPLPVPPKVAQSDVVTPKSGSPDRTALLDAVRPIYEKLFGKPIVFQVQTMRVAAGYAFMRVHPERPNGSPIDKQVWDAAIGTCEQTPASVVQEYWMKKVGGVWTIGLKNGFCADDSIIDDGDIIGAPPQLVGGTHWAPRLEYPIDAIATGFAEP
jgi:hypothetical protein